MCNFIRYLGVFLRGNNVIVGRERSGYLIEIREGFYEIRFFFRVDVYNIICVFY